MSLAVQKSVEPLSTGVASSDVWRDASAQTKDQPKQDGQKILQTERDRIRRIESTLSDLVGELGSELLETETRLAAVEQELAERIAQVESLRAELAGCASQRPTLFQPDDDDATSDPVPLVARSKAADAEAADKLLEAEEAFAESEREQEELRVQLARAHKQLNLRAQELNELRAELATVASHSAGDGNDAEVFAQELVQLRSERQNLLEQLAIAESKLKQVGEINLEDIDLLRRRFELAVQDVRELKAKNARLEQQLAVAVSQSPGSSPKGTGGNGMDWESMKQKLLARLESDFDSQDVLSSREKISIEGTVRITDTVVAEKDREIRELREALENASGVSSEAAIAELINRDEVIAAERDKLKRLEEELNTKLRKAEVEISVERATLARERTLLEEKRRALDEERANLDSIAATLKTNGELPAVNKPRGRWMARLGLKE